jgi:hypothetical protein
VRGVWDLRIDAANLDGGRYALVFCDQWQWRSPMSRTRCARASGVSVRKTNVLADE